MYKLYAVPVRITLPVSHIVSTREGMHYLWFISWVPMSHILSTNESYPQYPWVISSVPVSHILSTHEGMQYPWGYAVPVSKFIWMKNEWKFPHRYCIFSQVLRIWLTGTAYSHRYWGYDSRVLHILTGTEDMTHGYWWYDSRVMHILTGTAYPHG